ncbi:uncharacterized protein LOC134028644 isoform X2 [Osmerus eperlanus]|uniref:uncharacterized protein LOC134028644 isoform X2 n=1 Tax=Osmerus eperlanus TaxID=29151 RepID=UPI002E13DEAB
MASCRFVIHSKTCRLRRSLSLTLSPKRAKPVGRKNSDDLVAAHALEPYMYRHIQPRNSEAHQPNITVINPLMRDMETSQFVTPTGIPARPVLLDESTVPRGQMLPVCQNLCTAPSFKSMENNYKMFPPAFLHPTAGLVTSIMESQMFKPEMKQGPEVAVSSGVRCSMHHSSPVPSRIFNHIPMTPDQSWFVNWTSPSLLSENQTLQASSLGLNETCPQADGLSQHHVPPPLFEDGTPSILNSAASPWADHSAKDSHYCDPPPSLSSSCLAMSTLSSNPMTYSPQSFAASIWFDPTKLDIMDTPFKTDVAPNIVFSP